MAFKKMTKSKYPPRLWALVGYPGSGKSTFAMQMRGPILMIDADHRAEEVIDLAQGDVLQLSDNPAAHNDAETIAQLLASNMPGSGVRTIVVDSLTQIIRPLVTEAITANDRAQAAGEKVNFIASFKGKALAMRTLQDALTRWGTDTLWIYHLQDGRDNKAREVVTQTLPRTERARLHSSLNMELHLVMDDRDRRGVKVVWARRGRDGFDLWDDSGTWAGMPERIEAAVYDGLSEADQERIEREPPPNHFASAKAAIAWGMAQGVFRDVAHAQNAYDKVKREHNVKNAEQMRDAWVKEVGRRLTETPTPENDGTQDALFETEGQHENYYQNQN